MIRAERGCGVPLTRLCRVSGLSRAAYYRRRTSRKRELTVRTAMHAIALEFPWYGYRPMTRALRRKLTTAINEKYVRRLMRLDGLMGARRTLRRWVSPKHGFPRYPNLASDAVLSGIDQLWVADLTYVRLRSSFVFVAVILDAFSRRCIGWSLMTQLQAEIVIEALAMALRRRRPRPGLIHHSDQGVQYACREYNELLSQHNIRPSMSRADMPYDNARCERFIRTLKYEEVYVHEYASVATRAVSYCDGGEGNSNTCPRADTQNADGSCSPPAPCNVTP